MTDLGAARALLPAYVSWLPVFVALAIGAALGALCCWLAVRIAGRPLFALSLERAAELPWPERARLMYTLRIALAFAAVITPLAVGVTTATTWGLLPRLSAVAIGWCSALSALFGARRVWRKRARALPPPLRWRAGGLRSSAATLLVLRPIWVVLLLVVAFAPARFDLRAGVVLALAALAIVGVHLSWHLPICARFGLVRPASPKLLGAVRLAEERVGFSTRGVFEVRNARANAFAFPFARRLGFTETAVRELDSEELAAIAGHELGHLIEPRRMSLLRMATSFVLLPLAMARSLIDAFGPIGLLGAEVVVLVCLRLVRRFARRMEEHADDVAHAHESNPGVYARALEHIYRINMMPAVTRSRRAAHPHLYDRLTAAGVVPDYPRPAPPARSPQRLALLFAIGLPIVGCVAPHWIAELIRDAHPCDEHTLVRTAALDGGDVDLFVDLARLRSGTPDAIVLLSACTSVEPRDVTCRSSLVMELTRAGRCSEARAQEKRIAWPDQPTIDAKWPALHRAIEDCGLRRAGL